MFPCNCTLGAGLPLPPSLPGFRWAKPERGGSAWHARVAWLAQPGLARRGSEAEADLPPIATFKKPALASATRLQLAECKQAPCRSTWPGACACEAKGQGSARWRGRARRAFRRRGRAAAGARAGPCASPDDSSHVVTACDRQASARHVAGRPLKAQCHLINSTSRCVLSIGWQPGLASWRSLPSRAQALVLPNNPLQ